MPNWGVSTGRFCYQPAHFLYCKSIPATLSLPREVWLVWGNTILTLAVISILITAPLGAVAILALGPKLLDTDQKQGEEQEQGEGEEHTKNNVESGENRVRSV